MADSLADKIAQLPTLNKAQLLPIWAENFPSPPPQKLRKQLMVPILAYRMQEREYGGLSHNARKRLKEIARTLPLKGQSHRSKESDPNSGTKILRIWRGEIHEVLSTGEGYLYRGRQFSSLSRIAKEITGTHWSGPAFFGTKGKTK